MVIGEAEVEQHQVFGAFLGVGQQAGLVAGDVVAALRRPGDQRRDHQAEAWPQHGGDLIADRLAATGRHQDKRIAAGTAGRGGFHAEESGVEIGSKGIQPVQGGPIVQWDPERAVKVGDMVLGEPNVKKGKR